MSNLVLAAMKSRFGTRSDYGDESNPTECRVMDVVIGELRCEASDGRLAVELAKIFIGG